MCLLKIQAQGSRCVFSPFSDVMWSIRLNQSLKLTALSFRIHSHTSGGAAVVATHTKNLLHLWWLVLCEVQPALLNVSLTKICGCCWLCCTHLPLAHKPRAFLNQEQLKYIIDKCFSLISNLNQRWNVIVVTQLRDAGESLTDAI